MTGTHGWGEYLVVSVAAIVALMGIGLLVVGAYFTGFGWTGWLSIMSGLGLFTSGTLVLLGSDSAVSDRLIALIKTLFLSA